MQESSDNISIISDQGKFVGLMQVQPAVLHGEELASGDIGLCDATSIMDELQLGTNGHIGNSEPVEPRIAYYLNVKGYSVPNSLRWYNSVTIVDENNYEVIPSESTASYVSDIANRLMRLSPENKLGTYKLEQLSGFPLADNH